MSKQHREILFQAHSADLLSVLPGIKDVFVCPICFDVFLPESIKEDLVDVGHVWPSYFRQRSELAKHQHVLLCKKCNSNAGKAGDQIMQAEAELYEGEKTGKLGLRKLRVTKSSTFGEGIELDAYISKTGEKSLQIGFPIAKNKIQQRHFEEQRKKFYAYANEGNVNVTVFPPRAKPSKPFGDPTNAPLAQAGFLTSAYLLAFFEYGYRYILQTCLDPVRDYIQQSFDKNVDDRLRFEESKDTCVQLCPEPSHFRSDPEIGFVIAADEKIPFFQEVWFLNYHIRLPVPPILVGENRQELIIQFCDLSGQTTENIELIQSIICNDIYVSNVDHPILLELQKLT